MDPILDSDFGAEETKRSVVYAGFWVRLGALILDGILLWAVTKFVSLVSSTELMLALQLVAVLYRPFFEYQYGATPGKMAVGIKVVDLNFEAPTLSEVFMRNIFNIGYGGFNLFISAAFYFNSSVDWSALLSNIPVRNFSLSIIGLSYGILVIVEAIVLASDEQKRSIHDRIGKTYVIAGRS